MTFAASECVCKECGKSGHPWWDCAPGHSFGDDPIESYDDRNVDVQTRHITTRGARRVFMRKNHLEYVPKLVRRKYIDLGSR